LLEKFDKRGEPVSGVYCDKCGQLDKSITIQALLAQDGSGSVSNSYGVLGDSQGGIDLIRTTTYHQGDQNLTQLQARARAYSSGQHTLPAKPRNARNVEAAGKALGCVSVIYAFLALLPSWLLGGMLISIFGIGKHGYEASDLIAWVLAALVFEAGFIWLIFKVAARSLEKRRSRERNWQNQLTIDQKKKLASFASGSYCSRCDHFSPSHG
jgi:hypothetical protein